MGLTLSKAEIDALRHCLDNYLPELRYEMARIKLPRDRHEVVVFEEALTRIRLRLDETQAAAAPIPAAV